MDERKNLIKELENKKRADIEARNRLLEGLGETLLQRIGDEEPFELKSGETPGSILAAFRKLQGELAESAGTIKNLEAETLRLKELEEAISAKEGECSSLKKELEKIYARLGKELLLSPGSDDVAGPLKQREEFLLAKIGEQEKNLENLEERNGNVLAWLGKNARMAVSKTLLLKDRLALEKLYHTTGEKFLSVETGEEPRGETADAAGKAADLKGLLSSLAGELDSLKGERRKMTESFGAEGSPARRIQGIEKHIAQTKGEFPGIYRRLGGLAVESGGKELLASFLREEDETIFERAALFRSQIAEKEHAVTKLKTAITIDKEKAEIEKLNKAILNQKQKIAAANNTISDLEKQIVESEKHIAELKTFLI